MDTGPYTTPDTNGAAADSLIKGADPQRSMPRLRRDHVYQELRRRIMVDEDFHVTLLRSARSTTSAAW
jgi:hypothetical protein